MILNELITNAFKYAFPENKKGELLISLNTMENDTLELIVNDNGVGLPDGFTISGTDSLGMKIISLLVEQIEGEVEYESGCDRGTKFIVRFSGKNPV